MSPKYTREMTGAQGNKRSEFGNGNVFCEVRFHISPCFLDWWVFGWVFGSALMGWRFLAHENQRKRGTVREMGWHRRGVLIASIYDSGASNC